MTITYTKLRKNASKKIAALLDGAKQFAFTGYSRGMDDCFNEDGEVSITREAFAQWFEDNYSKMTVEVGERNGDVVCVVFESAPYYGADSVTVRFVAPVVHIEVEQVNIAVKPRMTLAAVQAYIALGFTSPLNHGAKEAVTVEDSSMCIDMVHVVWSESSVFNSVLGADNQFDIDKTISLTEYNRLVWLTLAKHRAYTANTGDGYGYDKTRVVLLMKDGSEQRYRHDISIRENDITTCWANCVEYVRGRKAS